MSRRAWLVALVALSACSPGAGAVDGVASARVARATPVPTPVATPRLAVAADGPELLDAPAVGRPPQPAIDARFVGALGRDDCVDRDVPAPTAGDPVLAVLDRTYALPSDYVPTDLVAAAGAGFTGTSGRKLVRAPILDDLAAMRAAMEAAGLTVTIDSAYRSYRDQASTFDSWVARLGYAEAVLRSARPGHSEHQLGTTLDLTSPGWGGRFGDWAVESAEGAWLAAHAWEYGFVMSYPAGSQADTCISYEPWHYRWIGRETASDQRASGRTLRRYLERLADG